MQRLMLCLLYPHLLVIKAPAMAKEFCTSSLNIISPEGFFCANSISTVDTDKSSVDLFQYGLIPFRSIREPGVCQWRGSEVWLPPPLW